MSRLYLETLVIPTIVYVSFRFNQELLNDYFIPEPLGATLLLSDGIPSLFQTSNLPIG